MENNENFIRLRAVFESVVGEKSASTMTINSTIDDVEGWDSMNFISLVIAVETEYNIRIDGLDAASMVTVKSILDYIDRKLSS